MKIERIFHFKEWLINSCVFTQSLAMSLGKNYANFSGRASRQEMFYFLIFLFLYYLTFYYVLTTCVESILIFFVLLLLGWLWVSVPFLSICIRRLRDSPQNYLWAVLLQFGVFYLLSVHLLYLDLGLVPYLVVFGVSLLSLGFLFCRSK